MLGMTDVHAPMRMKVREEEVAAKLLGRCQMLRVSMTTPHTAPLLLNCYIFIFLCQHFQNKLIKAEEGEHAG